MTPFGKRLHAAVRTRGRLCVGIDPHPGLLREWGLDDDIAGLDRFAKTVINALAGEVAVVKPQVAFFERRGARGVAVLEEVIATAREAGTLVIMDAKRGDIGSTMQAYADAFLETSSPLCADAVTVSPYLGFGSLRPMIDTAAAHGNGVFVLALTSNPEGSETQHAVAGDGRTVADVVLDHVRAENRGSCEWGSVGCVVGATIDAPNADLGVGGPLLAPGLGAQGAGAADLPRVFGSALDSVLPAVSRSVLRAGPDSTALLRAAAAVQNEVNQVVTGGSVISEQD